MTPRQGNNLPFKLANNNLNSWQGEEAQSSSNHNKGGVNINGQLRQTEVVTWPDYYNPNPWVKILWRANESEIEINGKINKALIDSGAMISMMSKEYCDEHVYEIQPLD